MKHRFKSIDNAVKRIRRLEGLLSWYSEQCLTLKDERDIMARLASDKPEFSNPINVWEAKKLRDKILSNS